MAEFVIEKERKKNTGGIWIQMAAVFAVLLSVFAAYESVFPTGITPGMIGGILVVVVFILGFLVWKKEHLGRKILLLMVFMGIAMALGRERLIGGIAPFVNRYIEQRNLFYHVNQPGIEAVTDSVGELAVLAGILLLLGVILSVVLRIRRGGILVLLVMLILVILAATVGHMPSSSAAWGMMAAGGLYLIVYHRVDGAFPLREIIMAAVVLALLYLCTLVTLPQIQNYKEAHQQEYAQIKDAIIASQVERLDIRRLIEDKLSYNSNYATGGIGEGNLKNLSENQPQGTEELGITVTERPESSIYLKAYVGTIYTGKEWKELETSQFREMQSYNAGRELLDEPFRRIENGSNSMEKQQIQIRILAAETGYGYAPYYAEVPANGSVNLDACIEGKGRADREYAYYSRERAENLSGDELGEASDLWESYDGFVQEVYADYPQDLERLADWCASIENSSVEAVADEIDQRFSADLRYSLTPGQMPENQDFTEYFLFGNYRGFCVHFATAATLIYRECGYPARYVEGYVISPKEFKRQEDGTYSAVVTDDMAHAWCETFDSQTGWRVREHTLPYLEESRSDMPEGTDQGQAMERQEEGIEEETDIPEENKDGIDGAANVDDGDAGKDSNNVNGTDDGGIDNNGHNSEKIRNHKSVLLMIRGAGCVVVIVFMIIWATVVLCIIQQKVRRQRKMNRFRMKKENWGIAAIYNEVCDICAFVGALKHYWTDKKKMTDWDDLNVQRALSGQGNSSSQEDSSGQKEPSGRESLTERQMMEQMKAGFPQLTEEEWEWLYDCAVRAAFAGESIGREECKQCYLLYRRFRKEVLRELKGWKKIWFLYGKVM